MSWNTDLEEIKRNQEQVDAEDKAWNIYEELKKAISEGYNGKTFGFHITPDVGKILTEQGLGYKTYKEEEPDIYSFPFEQSSVWIK